MIDVIVHLRSQILAFLAIPCVVVVVFLLARHLPGRRSRVLRYLESRWLTLARRPIHAVILLCVLQLSNVAIRATLSGPPHPSIHDEFSYLLAGDTFASGRLTNPTHPMWVHFESPHIIQTPTRMSMYPPAQGLFLAAGFLLGHPWIGVILSTLLMIGLVYWAARQWLPPGWALLVGLFGLGLVHGTYWTDSYWGGALNASAGALVTGAAGVLRKRASTVHLSLFALGAVLCAITRPYEGSILVSIFSIWLCWHVVQQGRPMLLAYLRRCLPAVLLLTASGCAFLYYNYRVTGDPRTMPYNVASERYLASRMFLFRDHPPTPEYRHPVMRDIYVGLRRASLPVYWRLFMNFDNFQAVYLSPLLFPLFLPSVLLLASRRRQTRTPIRAAFAGIIAILLLPYIHPHYYAPFAVCFFIASAESLRYIRASSVSGRRPGWIVCAFVAVLLIFHTGSVYADAIGRGNAPPIPWAAARAEILNHLTATPGRHLVLVRYRPSHNWHHEWVYNRSDIDGSPVVWAREMNPSSDAELLRYFSSRKAWLLDADAVPPRLVPHPGAVPTPLPRPMSEPARQR